MKVCLWNENMFVWCKDVEPIIGFITREGFMVLGFKYQITFLSLTYRANPPQKYSETYLVFVWK